METLGHLIGFYDDEGDRAPVPIPRALQYGAVLALALNIAAVALWAAHQLLGEWLHRGGSLLVGSQTATAALNVWGLAWPVIITAALLAVCLVALWRWTGKFQSAPRRLHRTLATAVVATVASTWHITVYMMLAALNLIALLAIMAAFAVALAVTEILLFEFAQRRAEAETRGGQPVTTPVAQLPGGTESADPSAKR